MRSSTSSRSLDSISARSTGTSAGAATATASPRGHTATATGPAPGLPSPRTAAGPGVRGREKLTVAGSGCGSTFRVASAPPGASPSGQREGFLSRASGAHDGGMVDTRFPFDPRDLGDGLAERAAGVLAPESALFEDLDAAGFGDALRRALRATLTHPVPALSASLRLAGDLARVPAATAASWLRPGAPPPVPLAPRDRRFADPAWSGNPLFYAARLGYLAA